MSGRPPPDSPQGNLIGLRSGAWDSMYRKREMEKAGMAPINAEATMKKMYEQVIGRQLERQKLIHDAEKKSPSLVEPESDALEAQKKKKKKDKKHHKKHHHHHHSKRRHHHDDEDDKSDYDDSSSSESAEEGDRHKRREKSSRRDRSRSRHHRRGHSSSASRSRSRHERRRRSRSDEEESRGSRHLSSKFR